MKATIWHNPRCSKSRETLALLETAGAEVEVIAYLDAPPTPAELTDLYAAAGIAPRDGLRAREAREAGIDLAADEATLITAMAARPALIERPLVRTDKGVRLCRPPERVHEIL